MNPHVNATENSGDKPARKERFEASNIDLSELRLN
jgi:hypothetical protein